MDASENSTAIKGNCTWAHWVENDPDRLNAMKAVAVDLLDECVGEEPIDEGIDSLDGSSTFECRQHAHAFKALAGLNNWT